MKTFLQAIVTLSLLYQAQSAHIDSPRSSPAIDCNICQYVMKFIRYQSLVKSMPLEEIKQKLKQLYKIAPSTFKGREYLSQVDVFASILKEGGDPQTLCQNIGKCPPEQQQQKPRANPACTFCTLIVNLIKSDIDFGNATVEMIIEIVRGLCDILSIKPIKIECNFILDKIEEIVQWIEDNVDPTDICKRLGLCPNDTQSTSLNDNKVDICHAVVHNLRIQNRKESSEEKMKEKIIPICNSLGLNRVHCDHIIRTNFNTVLTMIKRGMEIDEICGNKRFTSSNSVSVNMKNYPSNYCDFCMMIMETVKSELENAGTSLKNIEEKLNGMCSKLEGLTDECKYVVKFVMEDLQRNLKYIEGAIDPTTTCQALKLCSTSLEQ